MEKRTRKKHTTEEQDNPFRQEAPAPKQSADKPAPAAAAYVPPQPPVQQAGGHTVVLAAGNGGTARTTLMEAGSSGGVGELYLVQKATNQYIHVTHTNFHIGRAEDVVDYTVHTQNCYLGNDHAYILIENGNYYIVDNNTQNHTYLNEQRLEPSSRRSSMRAIPSVWQISCSAWWQGLDMALQLVHITDKGATRPSNQDSFCARISNFGRETIAMLAVCDGVGGLQSGELASTGAVRCF